MILELKNTIVLNTKEDYKKVGNSRLGGKPDLPKRMKYPVFSNGFFEFILQINLGDYYIQGLPNIGLLSIFYGSLDKHEAIGYYFDNFSDLEVKEIPKESKFAGVTDFVEHVSHKIKIEPKKIIPREKLIEYNDDQFTEEENISHWKLDFLKDNSFLMDNGREDKNYIYLKSNGFDRLLYGGGIRLDEFTNRIIYQGRSINRDYNSIEDLINCNITLSSWNEKSVKEWKNQLEKFEQEKNYHLKRFKEYRCLLSLASLYETDMFWGDSNKLEIYGYESDFQKKDFKNLNSAMPF